jgi:hypothetical protein
MRTVEASGFLPAEAGGVESITRTTPALTMVRLAAPPDSRQVVEEAARRAV